MGREEGFLTARTSFGITVFLGGGIFVGRRELADKRKINSEGTEDGARRIG